MFEMGEGFEGGEDELVDMDEEGEAEMIEDPEAVIPEDPEAKDDELADGDKKESSEANGEVVDG